MYDEETVCMRRFGWPRDPQNQIACTRSTNPALALSQRLDALLQSADGNVSFSGIFASPPSAMTSVT
jgi:hypothetical protein